MGSEPVDPGVHEFFLLYRQLRHRNFFLNWVCTATIGFVSKYDSTQNVFSLTLQVISKILYFFSDYFIFLVILSKSFSKYIRWDMHKSHSQLRYSYDAVIAYLGCVC